MPKERGRENILDFSLAISCRRRGTELHFFMTSWLCSYPQWFNSILGFSRLRCHFEYGLELIGNARLPRFGGCLVGFLE